MPLTKMTANVNNIQALSDRPNEADGLTSAELKEKFDKAGADIKTYLNTTLTEELDTMFSTIKNDIYPVGRVVMFYDNLDHSNYLGLNWQRCLVGKMPVGVNSSDSDFDSIGATGGEKAHTLTKTEQPHITGAIQSRHMKDASNIIDAYQGGGGIFSLSRNAGDSWAWQITGTAGANKTDLITFDNGGTDTPHNNMPPYEVVSFWKRIS